MSEPGLEAGPRHPALAPPNSAHRKQIKGGKLKPVVSWASWPLEFWGRLNGLCSLAGISGAKQRTWGQAPMTLMRTEVVVQEAPRCAPLCENAEDLTGMRTPVLRATEHGGHGSRGTCWL